MYQNEEIYVYQITTTLPNGRKILKNGSTYTVQTAIEYTNIFHSKALQKLIHIGIFGLKIYHLATLMHTLQRKWPHLIVWAPTVNVTRLGEISSFQRFWAHFSPLGLIFC
jgi:hypothetical protein